MKIVFFSESQINGKIPRDFPNARTEYAWMMALDAPHFNVHSQVDGKYDLGIVIIPKTNPNINLDEIRKSCDKVAVMQEGPHWYFQDYSVSQQFHYYNLLRSADWVYCHNESDVNYFRGLGCEDVRVMRSLMIPEGLNPRTERGNGTMIGGNFVSWYGGFDSFMVAMYLQDIFTVHANIVGLPAISLPIGKHSNSLPFGIQLMSGKFKENQLFELSKFLMQNH